MWEPSESGCTRDNECHLHTTLALSLTEERGRIKEGVMTVKDDRGPGLDFTLSFVYVCEAFIREGLPLYLLILPIPASFFLEP